MGDEERPPFSLLSERGVADCTACTGVLQIPLHDDFGRTPEAIVFLWQIHQEAKGPCHCAAPFAQGEAPFIPIQNKLITDALYTRSILSEPLHIL